MGAVPAQLLRGNTDASHLATMHGGLPSGSGSHRLVLAIYDERAQRQVEGATTVTPLGLGPTRRKLEPMQIGTSATYGNVFPMAGPVYGAGDDPCAGPSAHVGSAIQLFPSPLSADPAQGVDHA
jgi:hypothetical protein